MISFQYDARVRREQYQDLLRQAAQERLPTTVASTFSLDLFARARKWLDAQITRLRCTAFPSSAAQACTP